MPKATRLEQATRIETVRQLILSGHANPRIVQQVTAAWKIKERQAWNYVAKAQAEIEKVMAERREYTLAEHIALRADIRRRAREAGDLRAELAAAQDEAKLFGLYPNEQPGVSVTVNNQTALIGVTPVDYRNGLDALAPPEGGSIPDSQTPGTDESSGDGAALGQDGVGGNAGVEHAETAWAGSVDRADVQERA